jgi:hypothetical protein
MSTRGAPRKGKTMFDTMTEALAAAAADEDVVFCDTCDVWTIIESDGYPICYCA